MKRVLSRKEFVGAAGAGLAGLIAIPSALAADKGDKSQRPNALTIIDTHTHFYDPHRPEGVPWPSKDDKLLYRVVLPKHYRALQTPQPVSGTVIVEASPWIEDNEWILKLAEDEPFIVGFVGNLPVGSADFPKHLDHFAANPLFRGLRIGEGRLKEGVKESQFREHLRLMAERDLQLDLLGGVGMLNSAAQIARELPKLRIVIDHVAGARIDGKAVHEDWMQGMTMAAQNRNLYCKVSGLVEGTGKSDGSAPDDTEYYKPVLDAIWQSFGEDRLIYGSNWPVSERFASLATVQKIVEDYFSSKGRSALVKVFGENARAVYKWIDRK